MFPMILRLVLSLAFVAAMLYLAARIAKRNGLGGRAQLVEVVARQALNRTSSVSVLKVADRVFLVGATDNNVNLLAEMDEETVSAALADLETQQATAAAKPILPPVHVPNALSGSVLDKGVWVNALHSLREKTVRNK